jgi:tetratricopeptide (TPR) repeat protein
MPWFGASFMEPQLAEERNPQGGFDWRSVPLLDEFLREPVLDGQGLTLWFAGKRESQFQEWERVASLPHAEYTVEPGIGAVAATSIFARQLVQGVWGKLWQRFRKADEGRSWLLPHGEKAQQCGQRRSDLLFVWTEQDTAVLDEAWIKSRWPTCQEVRQVGKGLFMVRGVQPPDTTVAVELGPNRPSLVAEKLLASVRQTGDRRREATALTDLALMLLHENQVPRAMAVLEEALAIVRQLQDREAEMEVMGHAGLAMLKAGQPQRALELLEQRRSQASAVGDHFGEKSALEYRGFAYAQLRDHARSAACFEKGAQLARDVGHRKHEAEMLWYLAVQHAELGRREDAVRDGQAAVDLMEKSRNPQAAWYADHLRRFRAGERAAGLGGNEGAGTDAASGLWNGSLTAGLWQASATEPAAGSPGLLRMAVSAARSMAKFLGSGLKTTPAPMLQRRLRTCAACPHHTGLRCRLCGCFTAAKARMAHEECPIGKW